jgi:hypothetical protein
MAKNAATSRSESQKKRARRSTTTTDRETTASVCSPGRTTPAHQTRKPDHREVLFLLAWDLTRPFFRTLYQDSENAIADIPGVRPILRCLHRDPDGSTKVDAISLLRRERRWANDLVAIVVAPTGGRALECQVAQFCSDHKIPAVGWSLPFHCPSFFTKKGLPEPPAVCADGREACFELGRKASARFLRRKELPKTLRLLMIPGSKQRVDSVERLNEFKRGVSAVAEENAISVDCMTTESCKWQDSLVS